MADNNDAVENEGAPSENEDAPSEDEEGQEEDEEEEQEEDEEEEQVNCFNREMEKLQGNKSRVFSLYNATSQQQKRVTIPQAISLANALRRNTSVDHFDAYLECCTLPSIDPFLRYIRTSKRLKSIDTDYDPHETDTDEIQQCYKTELNSLFHAIAQNPYIQKIIVRSLEASPESIFDLLANTRAAEFAAEEIDDISPEIATTMAAGLCRASSLRRVRLSVSSGHLDVVLPGLFGSAVETVAIRHEEPGPDILDAVTKMLLLTPCLKELTFTGAESDDEGNAAKVFFSLRHPACTALKTLELDDVFLEDEEDTPAFEIVPNSSLKNLSLRNIRFLSPRSVCLLWNVVGLDELTIHTPKTYIGSTEDLEDTPSAEHWAEFIRRNKNLSKIRLIGYGRSNRSCLNGVLEGARNHPSLATMTIKNTDIGGDGGLRLCQVLKEAVSLKQMKFINTRLEQACSMLLSQGFCHNRSLDLLHFEKCQMEASTYTVIIESLLQNETLQDVAFKGMQLSANIPIDAAFIETLAEVLRSNKSVSKLWLSRIDLRSGQMANILSGLMENSSLKSLIFKACPLDNEGMTSLGCALESKDIALEEIGLPKTHKITATRGPNTTGIWNFLRSLAKMPRIQTVYFGHTMAELNEKERLFLCSAVKENKTIRMLDFCNDGLSLKTVEYYLKLNRFGRRLLDSPNVHSSIWPLILSRMTRDPNDADALFYFLREYFMRCNYPSLRRQQNDSREPPTKKARLEEDPLVERLAPPPDGSMLV